MSGDNAGADAGADEIYNTSQIGMGFLSQGSNKSTDLYDGNTQVGMGFFSQLGVEKPGTPDTEEDHGEDQTTGSAAVTTISDVAENEGLSLGAPPPPVSKKSSDEDLLEKLENVCDNDIAPSMGAVVENQGLREESSEITCPPPEAKEPSDKNLLEMLEKVCENNIAPSMGAVSDMEKAHTYCYRSPKVVGTDTSFAVFAPTAGTNLPVFLFQTGYGMNSCSHAPILTKIAAQGFVVVTADREGDMYGGKLSAVTSFGFFLPLSAVSVDGSHMEMAMDFVEREAHKDTGAKIAGRVDLTKLAASGYSMGANEAINFAADHPDQCRALVIISGSLAKISHAVFKVWGPSLERKVAALNIPSLWINSEGDFMKEANDKYHSIAAEGGGDAILLTIKDSALDLSCHHTKKTSMWFGPFTAKSIGFAQHFSLACEEMDVSNFAVSLFLKKVFFGEEMNLDGLPLANYIM